MYVFNGETWLDYLTECCIFHSNSFWPNRLYRTSPEEDEHDRYQLLLELRYTKVSHAPSEAGKATS